MRHPRLSSLTALAAVSGLLSLSLWAHSGRGDEPSRLGRFFRFGASAPNREPTETTDPTEPTPTDAPAIVNPSPTPATAPRLVPQPRVSRAITEADPLVTRVALGRSNDGARFGMFLQVYADGTVIDSEGVHAVGREAVREVANIIGRGDVFRVRGHCGEPSADFVEHVQMVVYERNLGRLRANSFSFSGNPHGCDRAVHQLQTALDALQAKLGQVGSGSTPSRPADVPAVAPPILLNGGEAAPAGHDVDRPLQ